ncbi:MAG: glycosyltransferase family 4 protein [Anaerolineae bacterium]|nr:glycosyltransferase family 4 protein [Anaerolineae bacterium]
MPGKIAYVMSRFPHLPETFILREMSELERQGWTVALYPLVLQTQPVVHAEAARWLPEVHHVPFASGAVLAGNGRAFWQHPTTYLHLWGQTIAGNVSDPNMLLRACALFPKAVQVAAQMQAEGINHIHAHYATHPAFFAWLIHQLTGISYSLTVHAHDIFVRTAMLEAKLRSASFIVAISDYNVAHLSRVVGPWVQEKTAVIHCGITPELYQPRSAPAMSCQPLEIINIGSLQPYKGQAFLVQACALLKQAGIPFRCRIIGGGEEQSNLLALIKQLDLQEQVQLLGPLPQEEVAALLPTATCYVQPSVITPSGKMEGIPVSLMEALACAVPVVATELSGVPELVQDGQTGYLVPPANAGALAQALQDIYESPEAAFAMAVAGRELVLKAFHLQQNVAELASLFKQYAGKESLAFQTQLVTS